MRKTLASLAVFAAVLANAQSRGSGTAFEVASVKPSASGAPGMTINRQPGGRVTPDWFDNVHFDIVAKPENEIPSTPEGLKTVNLMLQALIIERFSMVIHRETRELPIFALVVARGGPKIAPTATPGENSWSSGRGQLAGKGMTIESLVKALSGSLGRTVLDQTGLTGDTITHSNGVRTWAKP
jgi:hypothetical protein